ncbi:hypothetical protein P7C73_g5650, partial [Tremellales sp. Uapishka_1]
MFVFAIEEDETALDITSALPRLRKEGSTVPNSHADEEWHRAEFWKRKEMQYSALLQQVRSSSEIVSQAEKLRPGYTAQVLCPDTADDTLSGGQNVHFPVRFHDGEEWLARIQHVDENAVLPAEMRKVIVQSEVETVNSLHQAGVRVPRAWNANSHDSGLDYFFVERIHGYPGPLPLLGDFDPPLSTPKLHQHLIRSYAEWTLDIENLTVPAIGSLHPTPKGNQLGVLVTPAYHYSLHDPPYFPGPFATNRDRYCCVVQIILDDILAGTRYVNNPVAGYLYHLEIMALVKGCPEMARKEERHYVKHADDSGTHVFVDQQGNVVGLIDWDWAYFTTKYEAFSPGVGFSEAFAEGNNTLSAAELLLIEAYRDLKRPDLADCVVGGKKYQRLPLTIGWPLSLALLWGLQTAFRGGEGARPVSLEAWVEMALTYYREDEGLKQLQGTQARL